MNNKYLFCRNQFIFNPQTAHFTWAISNCTLVRIGISATSNLYISVIFFSKKMLPQ